MYLFNHYICNFKFQRKLDNILLQLIHYGITTRHPEIDSGSFYRCWNKFGMTVIILIYLHLIHQVRIIFADPNLKLFPAKQGVFKNRSIRLKDNLCPVGDFRIISFACNRMLRNSADVILFIDFPIPPDCDCKLFAKRVYKL